MPQGQQLPWKRVEYHRVNEGVGQPVGARLGLAGTVLSASQPLGIPHEARLAVAHQLPPLRPPPATAVPHLPRSCCEPPGHFDSPGVVSRHVGGRLGDWD